MGVPRLFPWIKRSFPSSVERFQEGEKRVYVDNLYIDAPGLLHNSAQKVNNYGDKKRMLDPYVGLDTKKKRRKVFELFFDSIIRITEIVIPQNVLFIAIDGTAPSAKQKQQRERRFIAAGMRSTGGFDSSSMTPGTKFMHELSKYMNYAIRKRVNGAWRNIKVVYSPPTVPGEGEHKCLDYIRDIPSELCNELTHCFFGPDGDLIMLTLAAHVNKMFLFREDLYNVGYYHLLDMGIIRKKLPSVVRPALQEQLTSDINAATDDFILIGFFVGNDFLPRIQMFLYLEDGLELMISRYGTMTKTITVPTKNGKSKISKEGFQTFIKTFAVDEIQYLIDQTTKHVESDLLFNKILQDNINIGKSERGVTSKVLDWNAYRKAYYSKAEIVDIGDKYEIGKGIEKMCCDYLRTMSFVYEYYLTGVPSWDYYYPWHYPPLMTDFSEFLHGLTQSQFDDIISFNDSSEPALPFVQLLSVLPPASSQLLPSDVREIMMNPKSPLVKKGYYPTSFEIDYEGKLKEHEGIALLPFVDRAFVQQVYDSASKHISTKYLRNVPGKNSTFVYDDAHTSRYKNSYGLIPKLHVVKSEI